MRPIAFALLLLGATACPVFASGTLIEAKSSTFGCQFSATLGLFQELSTVSEEDSNRILDTGHCLPIDAHQRFTVIRDLPSAYVALKDTQQDDQWVVVFVRKTDFDPLHGSPDHIRSKSARSYGARCVTRGSAAVSRGHRLNQAGGHGGQGTSLSDSDCGEARGGTLEILAFAPQLRRQRHSRGARADQHAVAGCGVDRAAGNPRRRI